MSIVKFASFSHNERTTCKLYFPHEKPFSFMGITKNSKLFSYYKTRRIFSRITSAGSGEPQPKLITFPKSNHIRNDSTIYASVEAPTLELQYEKAKMENEPTKDVANGIGIAKFIEGKSFFVTGATGFLSKVFVEKMLRTTPDIRKIYLLIRAEAKDDAMKRLKNEILDVELFKPLKEIHGNSFEEFMMSKFIPVAGNVCEPNLGLDSDIADEIANEIDVIVNSAAITTFDERYDMALEANTRGPSRLISFAKKCKKLKVLLHFSTVFANRDKNGVVYEKTLSLGSSLTNGKVTKGNEPKALSIMDIEAEMELAFKSRESFEAQNVVSKLKELGLKRASHYRWPNTYSFTKAMGEMLMNDQRGEVQLVIIRPSIVESTYNEPFPGWIQGNRVLEPMLIYYGKGKLQGIVADPDGYFNIVPADMVVNASLAAMAKHGFESMPGTHVYHVTSSSTKPLLVHNFFIFVRDYFVANPFTNSEGKRITLDEMKYFSKIDDFSTFLLSAQKVEEMAKLKRKTKSLLHLSKIYQPYTFYKGSIESLNTKNLMANMSEKEKVGFDFDFEDINWRDYVLRVHVPGVKKHVMKGRDNFRIS